MHLKELLQVSSYVLSFWLNPKLCFVLSAGKDYITLSKIVEFQPGETEKIITIHILDDSRVERAESFELYLTGGDGVHLSSFFRAEITIPENDGNIKYIADNDILCLFIARPQS